MGLIHIYCGDGKGKTTAAMGLALRAAGSGMKVYIVQLLKGADTSELASLKLIPNITAARCDKNYGFTFSMTEENMRLMTECHNKLLSDAEAAAKSGEYGMLIIDEFNAAYEYGYLDRRLADRIVLQKPEALELVLTGRDPQQKFIDAADYVSEIKAVKHPFDKGITARKGIEY